jgi:hypothetical protein
VLQRPKPSKPAVDDDENQPVKTISSPPNTQKKSSEIGTDDDLMTVYLKLQNQYKQHQSSVQKKDNPKY